MSDLSSNNSYVVALSGGVDSVVLLDALVNNRLSELTSLQSSISNLHISVAHFDHGIREDSSSDEQFARGVAGDYGLPYESERAELGAGASEDLARTKRYNFLRRCCNISSAQLITAHQQDDVLETMVINLLRGTGWRGLAPMVQISSAKSQIPDNIQISNIKYQNSEFQGRHPRRDVGSSNNNQISNIKYQILRPLLNVPKSKILEYAKKYNLKWREDSTNINQDYLRNYVRLTLLPKMYELNPGSRNKLLDINKTLTGVKNEIATELQKILFKYQISNINYLVPRYDLIMYPPAVSREIIHSILTQLDSDWHPSSQQINRALHFIKTGLPGKQMEISKHLNISLTKVLAQFKNDL